MAPSPWIFSKTPRRKISTLADHIIEKYVDSKFDHEPKQFLPEDCIDVLVTLDNIIKELLKKDELEDEDRTLPETVQDIVDFICGPAKKVFLITIVSDLRGDHLYHALDHFKEIGFNDKSLPFKGLPIEEGERGQEKDPFFRQDETSPWSKKKIHDFCHEQWRFLVPVFCRNNFKHKLDPEHILPFTEKYNLATKEGNFAQVYEIKIHSDHHKNKIFNSDGSLAKLAIKEFKLPPSDEELQKDAEDVWESEVETLDEISDLKHDNLIQRIAAITRGRQRFLMFLWADGGNLRDFWKRREKPELTASLVRDIINQIRGMADALHKLHNYKDQYHYRHGDIKPENILHFPHATKDSSIGTFKISDLGSAKHHSVATRLRERTGSKAWATMEYQPPEAMTNQLSKGPGPTSRLYDIWSLGCVALEFMIWLLYGYKKLEDFKAELKSKTGKLGELTAFFILKEKEEVSQSGTTSTYLADIHPAVKACLETLSKDQECAGNTALSDLLDIIKTKLLVVRLPERTDSSLSALKSFSVTNVDGNSETHQPGHKRASALSLVGALDDILNKGKADIDEHYWHTGQIRDDALLPEVVPIIVPDVRVDSVDKSSHLFVGWATDSGPDRALSRRPFTQNQDRINLSNDWSYPVDNDFATHVIKEMGPIPPTDNHSATDLCDKCKDMDFWAPRFRIEETWSELESTLNTCAFCKLRWDISKHLNRKDHTSVTFERRDSTLKMNDSSLPVLSICRTPESNITIPVQIGYPQLPGAGSDAHFNTLRQWVNNCDERHGKLKCRPSKTGFLPTRLIDVGEEGSNTIRLYETKEKDSLEYVALSHPWGQKPPEYFCTYRSNVESFKQSINVADLRQNFRDAVATTRALRKTYLWIDSICIIQGPDGDFDQEAQHMESVFNSAYCVLAASSAVGQSTGFLNERKRRDFVTFKRGDDAPFYICRFIDDFNQDVIEGSLNKRGWVMQERVLARRTIYFTDKQCYWECGEGVRCETLTKMENKLESFLGDPNFPEKVTSGLTNRGQRIVFYEDLYRQYSRLAFTKWEDRPIAIAGLEKRLISDLGTRGGFGVFDDGQSLLRRSLLWQRGDDNEEPTLRRITFPPERNMTVPTWSWMAYEGGIDFLELPLGGVEWLKDQVNSPWPLSASGVSHTLSRGGSIELSAIAREFNTQGADSKAWMIVSDIPERKNESLKCIVMGRRREEGKSEDDARHYVLFIARRPGENNVYERVGVGFMPGKFIEPQASEKSISVKVR